MPITFHFASPYFHHHWDSKLLIGKNQPLYDVLLFRNGLKVKSRGLSFMNYYKKRELELLYGEIVSINKKGNEITLTFYKVTKLYAYSIYHSSAAEIYNYIVEHRAAI